MKVLRPIRKDDQDAFESFAQTVGMGVTSLPKNSDALRDKIKQSERAFSGDGLAKDGLYVFVLEDFKTGELGGTSAAYAETCGSASGFFYHVEELQKGFHKAPTPKERRLLTPLQRQTAASEIGGLYLTPDSRNLGVGRLLSLARLLFIATFPKRFHKRLIVEMRGCVDEAGVSPFWEGVGRHLIDLSFEEMMLKFGEDPTLVECVVPKHSLYVGMLSKKAQEVIGKPHENSAGAMQMLIREGFSLSGDIDLFDGGPKLCADTHAVYTVATSKEAKVISTSFHSDEGVEGIVSNGQVDFRAVQSKICEEADGKVFLPKVACEALQIKTGDRVRYRTL